MTFQCSMAMGEKVAEAEGHNQGASFKSQKKKHHSQLGNDVQMNIGGIYSGRP